MVSIRDLNAAQKFGAGYFVREQMIIRGWVQEELADVLGISAKHLNSIVQNKQTLNIVTASMLANAFGTSAQYWLNIDNDYRLWLKEENTEYNIIAVKAMIYERMPVRDMMKKGWLGKTRDINILIKLVKDFWDINDLDFRFLEENILPYCKRSNAFNKFNASYAATWFQMAKLISEKFIVPEYNEGSLRKLHQDMHSYTNKSNGIELFLDQLLICGVKFFVLPHLEKTYLDGAVFFHNSSPAIVYTARYKRIDNFWFTVAHELAHLLNHIGDDTPFVLDNLREEAISDKEIEANAMAAKSLIHNEILEYLEKHLNYLTLHRIEECSGKLNIHPAIIIGALAFNKTISYQNINLFNDNVLKYIPSRYVHKSLYL